VIKCNCSQRSLSYGNLLTAYSVLHCHLVDSLYQTGAVTKRAAKPDEVVMSIDGSPLMNCNSTIMLPVNKSQACILCLLVSQY